MGGFVACHPVSVDGIVLNPVGAWNQKSCRNDRVVDRVAASHIGDYFGANTDDHSVIVYRSLNIVYLIAPVHGHSEMFSSCLRPFHWSLQFERNKRNDCFVLITSHLHTERSAYIRCYYSHVVLRNSQQFCQPAS